jgi:hypothetical protein
MLAGDLKRHPKNPNKHSPEQIERLSQILAYQGWRYAIKVSRQSGFITSGHGRLEAAIKAGEKNVPVVFQDYDNDEQEYADIVADNAIASWSELDLANINTEIGELGPDFDIDLLGIKDFTLDVAEKLEPGCDEDDVPEKVEPKTKLGDIYRLGRHRLMCGDSTSIDDVEKLMNGEKADMVFTDPPYNVGIDYGSSTDDDKTEDAYKDWSRAWFGLCHTSLIVFTPGAVNLALWYSIQKPRWLCSWRKSNQCSRSGIGGFCTWEPVLVYGKPIKNVGHDSWDIPVKMVNIDHPVPKSVEAWATILDSFASDTSIIYDPFGDSGTTLVVSEKTNRKCFMMELDPYYCDIIVARWEKYTGQKAELTNG